MSENILRPKGGEKYWKIPCFLPSTRLKKGAKGRTVKVLQLALYDYYKAKIITTSPIKRIRKISKLNFSEDYFYFYNPFAGDKFGVFGVHTEKAVREYSATVGAGEQSVVEAKLWQALGLTVGEKLEDLFNIPTDNQKGRLKLKVVGNEVIVSYRPLFYLSQLPQGGRFRGETASSEVRDYYISLALDGLFRWSGEEVNIGGITAKVILQLVDKHGNITEKEDTYTPANFSNHRKWGSNIFLYKGIPHQSKAFFAPYWKRNLNVIFSAGDTYSNKKSIMAESTEKGEQAFRTTVQHEFGHALGLTDAYSYENHLKFIPLIGKKLGRLIAPDSTDITGRLGVMAYGSEVKKLDYEMILFAWLRNRWQSYKGGILGSITGEISQSFFYF